MRLFLPYRRRRPCMPSRKSARTRTRRAGKFFSHRRPARDVRQPQTKLSASVRAWSCLLGLSRVGDEDHCGVTRRNFAVSVLRPRVVAIDPAASDAHAPCIPGRASTNRFPGFSREALVHIGQPSPLTSFHRLMRGQVVRGHHDAFTPHHAVAAKLSARTATT
jgi:hypothetical protein